jgi:fatty acid kinase fatty acid binding subunit
MKADMTEAQQGEPTAASGHGAAAPYLRGEAATSRLSEDSLALPEGAPGQAPGSPEYPTGRIAIVCESTACLPPELARRYGITTIPIPFTFGNDTFLDGVDITPGEFYARLKATRMPPRTSPPSPGEYLERWAALSHDGRAVMLVTASGTITSFSRSTRLAQELARESLPQARIAIVDSGSAAMGQGFVTLAAARAAAQGADLSRVVAAAERVRDRVEMIVTLDTLEYLARASRIPQVAAWVGGVLAIKPVILFARGDVHQLARVRTRHRSVEQLLLEMRRRIAPGARVHVAIHHTQAEDEALALRDQVTGEFVCVESYLTEFTAVMGAYCGPGLLGVAYYVEDDEHDRAG